MTDTALTFDEVYRRHRRDVRKRVLQVVGPVHCDDVTQDAWIKICRKLHTYTGRANHDRHNAAANQPCRSGV